MREEKLVVKIMADISDMKKGMKDATSEMGEVKKETGKMSDGFKKIGKVIAGAFAVKKIIDFGKQIALVSADVQAQDALFDQLFDGTGATEMLKDIEKKTGINYTRLKDGAIASNSIIKTAFGEGAAAVDGMSDFLLLGADNAAAYNMTTDEANASMISFMQGNYKAGNAIGITTNATQMAAWANEEYGVAMDKLPLEEQIEMRLRYAEAQAELNGTVGQATRESGEYENSMLNLKDSWKQFQAVIGAPVLDMALVVINFINDALGFMTEWLREIDFNPFEEGSPILENLKAVADEVKEFFVIAWPTIKEVVGEVFGMMKKHYDKFAQPMFDLLMKAVKVVKSLFKAVWPVVQTIVEVAFKFIQKIYDNILAPVFEFLINLVDEILDIVQENMPAIETIFKNMASQIEWAYETFIEPAISAVGAIVKWMMDMFMKYTWPLVKLIATWFINIAASISDKMIAAREVVDKVVNKIKGFFDKFIQIKDNVVKIFGDIYTGIKDKIEAARDVVDNVVEKIKGFFKFEWSLPKLKLPSVSMSGKFSLLPPSVPKFGISWKARGAIFKKPTVLESGVGVGDASNGHGSSPEVVAPLSDLKQMLGLDENKGNTTINLNGNYQFRDKDDMDYLLNEMALVARR